MSIEKLKAALPEYAKDIKLNLSSITRSSVLDQEQLWGTLLASAAATRNPQVLADIGVKRPTICRLQPATQPSEPRPSWA